MYRSNYRPPYTNTCHRPNTCAETIVDQDCKCDVKERSCGCERENKVDSDCMPSQEDTISCKPIAMAYVLWQDFCKLYQEDKAWDTGTIFMQLDLEFMARRCN